MAEEKEELEGDVIVIDNGTGFIKAGWAGEDAPRFVIPAIVCDNHAKAMPATHGGMETDSLEYLVGHDALNALHNSASEAVTYPIKRGTVEDWDALQKIWDHIFKNCLNVDPTQYPVLMTCPPMADKEMQTEIARRMFKHFNVPALCLCNASVLSLFSTGRTTGVVLEVGEGVTYSVPVYEGFSLPHATLKLPLAGVDVTKYLMTILSQQGIKFSDSHFDIVQDIKEKLCALRTGMEDETEVEEASPDELTYELPDGQVIQIDEEARYTSSEILFEPNEVIATCEEDFTEGVAKMVYKSIEICDAELQKDLFKNIVLAGGSSMMTGFGDRMRREMTQLVGQYQFTNIILDSQRKNSAWIGGSMYASLETFGLIKITSQEYLADNTIVFKKFFG